MTIFENHLGIFYTPQTGGGARPHPLLPKPALDSSLLQLVFAEENMRLKSVYYFVYCSRVAVNLSQFY